MMQTINPPDMTMNFKTLINPFERYQERTLMIVGRVAIVVGCFIAYVFNARYDGVVDLHFAQKVRTMEPFFDNMVNIVCLLLPLFIVGRIINKKTRVVDVLTAILIARIPYYVLPFFNANNFIGNMTEQVMRQMSERSLSNSTSMDLGLTSGEMVLFLAFAGLSILALIWMIVLLYNGFKTATNLKSLKHKVYFVLALIVAEVLSKIIILKMITQTEI